MLHVEASTHRSFPMSNILSTQGNLPTMSDYNLDFEGERNV